MKIRASGMPDMSTWEDFFDVPFILDALGVDDGTGDVLEVGCGYGTFSIPAARRIGGILYALDIDAKMVAQTQSCANSQDVQNVRVFLRDFITAGSGLPAESVDLVFLFNILHHSHPVNLLCASARNLRPAGQVCIIHWRSDISTPRGPPLDIRPRPEQIMQWLETAGLQATQASPFLLPEYHFGILAGRPA